MSKILEGRFNKRHIRVSCKFGYCYYSFEDEHGPEYVHIYNLFVFHDYRGQRKARVILQKAIDEIRENEYMGDIEIVARSNDNSIDTGILEKFYESMDLKVFPCYSKEKESEVIRKQEIEKEGLNIMVKYEYKNGLILKDGHTIFLEDAIKDLNNYAQKEAEVPETVDNTGSPKLPPFIDVYNEANRINGRHIENGVHAIVKGCYEFIER